jgi:succinate dehydrogenase/fumarate reductase-like Fe-S protein
MTSNNLLFRTGLQFRFCIGCPCCQDVSNASNILPRRFLNPEAIAYRNGPLLNTGQTRCDRQLGTEPPKQNI